MPSRRAAAACAWLSDDELGIYAGEYARTGFQGALQWYRCRTAGTGLAELQVFHGRTIDVPSLFVAGERDWGIYQSPGAIERMQSCICTAMRGCHLVGGAGHWVQQEQPGRVTELLLGFLRG
jgi:pimeloyl-ACP methyl ester carboxylesterase